MKKLIIFAVVLGSVAAFTSCKKDYNCTCTGTITGITYSVDTTFTDMKKADAETQCNSLDWTFGTDSQDCELD